MLADLSLISLAIKSASPLNMLSYDHNALLRPSPTAHTQHNLLIMNFYGKLSQGKSSADLIYRGIVSGIESSLGGRRE